MSLALTSDLSQASLNQLQAHIHTLQQQMTGFNSFRQKLLDHQASHDVNKGSADCAMSHAGEALSPAAFEKLWKQLDRKATKLQVTDEKKLTG